MPAGSTTLLLAPGPGSPIVAVGHSPIGRIKDKRSGTILVKMFVDSRRQKAKQAIGSIPWGAGPFADIYIFPSNAVVVTLLMTGYVAEVLSEAGYHTYIESSAASPGEGVADAILQGEVEEFWLYGGPLDSRQQITVTLKLYSADGKNLLWEKKIAAAHDQSIIGSSKSWGNKIQIMVTTVLDEILNQAAKQFSSHGFQQAVKEGK